MVIWLFYEEEQKKKWKKNVPLMTNECFSSLSPQKKKIAMFIYKLCNFLFFFFVVYYGCNFKQGRNEYEHTFPEINVMVIYCNII